MKEKRVGMEELRVGADSFFDRIKFKHIMIVLCIFAILWTGASLLDKFVINQDKQNEHKNSTNL